MSGMRQKIQYSLALEPAHQGETPVGGCQGTEPVVAKPAPQSPALAPTPCRCPSLTPSNRRVRDPYARWCGRGGTARCPPIPIEGTIAVRRSPPTLRLVCPCPVRSSNRTASPGPNRRAVPSPITTSIWPPERKMAYWRRGALCQSLKRPLGERGKVILLAACSIDLSMSGGSRSRSSKCDRLSAPV